MPRPSGPRPGQRPLWLLGKLRAVSEYLNLERYLASALVLLHEDLCNVTSGTPLGLDRCRHDLLMILDLREGRQPCSETITLAFTGPVLADRHGVQVLDFHQVGS